MRVFIDAKLLDIEATVERATAAIARTGAEFLTVHALDRKTLDAAVRGRGDSALKLLGVTVLTNLGPADLVQQGTDHSAWRARAASRHARTRGWLRRRRRLGPRGCGDPRTPRAPDFSSSRRASGRKAAQPRTRRGSQRQQARLPPAPTISWSAGRSPRRRTRAPRPRPSSQRSRALCQASSATRCAIRRDKRIAHRPRPRPASAATCRHGRR